MRIKKIFCGSVGTSRCSVKWFVGRSSNRRTANKNTPPDYWNVFFFLSCCLFYVYFNSTYHLDIFLYLYVLTETVLFTLFLQQVSESFFKRDVWNIRLCDSLYRKKIYLSEKESVSVYRQPIWQMWCSLSPSDTNPSFYYLYKMTSK